MCRWLYKATYECLKEEEITCWVSRSFSARRRSCSCLNNLNWASAAACTPGVYPPRSRRAAKCAAPKAFSTKPLKPVSKRGTSNSSSCSFARLVSQPTQCRTRLQIEGESIYTHVCTPGRRLPPVAYISTYIHTDFRYLSAHMHVNVRTYLVEGAASE